MNKTQTFQTLSCRKAALWRLVAALALLLVVGAGAPFGSAQDRQGGQGAAVQGSPSAALRTGRGAEVQGSMGAREQSPIPNTQSLPSSRTVVYAYDAAGRLASVNYGRGVGIAYSYDATGNLLRREATTTMTLDLYLPLVLR